MSIPEQNKKTSHNVIKVTYDTQKMHKLVVFNIILSLLLIFGVWYLTDVIDTQNTQINQLSKILNQLSFKIQQQNIMSQQKTNKIVSQEIIQAKQNVSKKNIQLTSQRQFIQQVQMNFQLNKQEIKKIRIKITQLSDTANQLSAQFKTALQLIQQQSKSSWEIKLVIENIKKRLQFITQLFKNIQIPKPDFSSVGDKIKGTFNNMKDTFGSLKDTVKDTVGNMFKRGDSNTQQEYQQNTDQNKQDQKKQQTLSGFRDIGDRFRRGWRSYTGGNTADQDKKDL